MPEPSTPTGPAATRSRPFPWFCTRCRRKEVVRAVIPYQCQRFYQGRPITITIAELTVPRCAHCGELECTYETEAQINQAYKAQTGALPNLEDANGPARPTLTEAPAAEAGMTEAPNPNPSASK